MNPVLGRNRDAALPPCSVASSCAAVQKVPSHVRIRCRRSQIPEDDADRRCAPTPRQRLDEPVNGITGAAPLGRLARPQMRGWLSGTKINGNQAFVDDLLHGLKGSRRHGLSEWRDHCVASREFLSEVPNSTGQWRQNVAGRVAPLISLLGWPISKS